MFWRLLILSIFGSARLVSGAEPARALHIEVSPQLRGAPLVFNVATHQISGGQKISVTRLDFLLSGFSLRHANGSWISISNSFAYLNSREGRTKFALSEIPAGQYERIRFHVGVPGELNHADPSALAPSHPLNPNLNGLHWNWQGGYVFLALEGHWQSMNDALSGYSFHIATDRLFTTIELPVSLAETNDLELRMILDVAKIFTGKQTFVLSEANSSTHSRMDDPLADLLRENLESAFSITENPQTRSRLGNEAKHPVEVPQQNPPSDVGGYTVQAGSVKTPAIRIEMARDATPYRLRISSTFPRPALPLDNPLTEEGVELGRQLFFDPTLSVNNAQSCASCHALDKAFTDGRTVSPGADGKNGTRNAMPLFNLAWRSSFFWDGRAASLREQVLEPIQNPVEMHETLTNVVAKLQSIPGRLFPAPTKELEKDYPALFGRAFGSTEITADRMARALEQFLLTQVSFNSRFDRALDGKDSLTEEEKRGFELFNTEYDPRRQQFGADCFHCHGGPLFQSQTFANNGLDSEFLDLGRYIATKRAGDQGRFAVPSLRNVALTAPYMHDGRFKTLEEVVEHYSSGVKPSATLDPNLAKHPDGGIRLSEADKQALVAFLQTLTDEKYTK